MKSLKHIFGLLMMGAMIIAAGCNKEENGGKKENLPHPNSTYKACPIWAHIWNDKFGIKEINEVNGGKHIYHFDKEQRLIYIEGSVLTYKYNNQNQLIYLTIGDYYMDISYDAYGFINSIHTSNIDRDFIYSHDTVFVIEKDKVENKEIKYIIKFSDDLYPISRVIVDGSEWEKWSWKDGNLISWYNSKGDKEEYQYDDNPNIFKLFGSSIDSDPCIVSSKNNTINKNFTYIYNEKGFVETLVGKDEQVVASFDYIYY